MKERIASVDVTSSILFENGINPKIRYGQNFMVSNKIPSLICSNQSITPNSLVIEIGPGIGGLTQYLCEKAKKVIAIEIDTTLANILKNTLKEYSNLEIINEDFLKFDLDSINYYEYDNAIIVSNLPYYITSEILIKLFKYSYPFTIIAMMQKEVANRLLKKEDINDLVLYANMFSLYSKLTDVSKNDFFPKPSIDSSVLKFIKNNDESNYFIDKIISVLYKQRRKTIYNNLKHICDSYIIDDTFVLNILKDNNLTINSRIDELSLDDVIKFIKYLESKCLIKCNAKLNIGLNIKGIENGYHNFESIYVPISLYDFIESYPINNNEFVYNLDKNIEDFNLIKANKYLKDHKILNEYLYTHLNKQIPIKSGLGGGSSDIYFYLNKFIKDENQLNIILKEFGQDCFYFKNNTPASIINFNEYKKCEFNFEGYYALLICDQNGISTKDCFDLYDKTKNIKKYDLGKGYFEKLTNNLIEPAIKLNPHILDYLNILKEYDLDFISMSGSGNCVYGLSKDIALLNKIRIKYSNKINFIKIVKIL